MEGLTSDQSIKQAMRSNRLQSWETGLLQDTDVEINRKNCAKQEKPKSIVSSVILK